MFSLERPVVQRMAAATGMDVQRLTLAALSVCPWDWVPEVTLHLHICSNLGASLLTQMVENPFAMRKTLIQPLGQEDSLEKGMATHSSILGLSW